MNAQFSSSRELDKFNDELATAANTYGVPIDMTLTREIQSRRKTLEERENSEDTDPYQQAKPQTAVGEISDAEIKSMFSLIATGPGSG